MGSYDLASELENTTAEERGTKLHDEGDYNFVVNSAEDGGETSNGHPKLTLKVEIIDGPYRGHIFTKDVIYSRAKQTGIRFFWSQLKNLGLEEDFLVATKQTTFDAIAGLLEGAQFEGHISHREWPTDSGQYREDLMIKKGILNPNVGGGAVTGVVTPPAQDDPWAEPAAGSAAVEAEASGVPTDVSDPWGATSK